MGRMAARDDYPELASDVRQQVVQGFNANNSAGWARLEIESTARLLNPGGAMHGGASFGLADSAVAAALIGIYGFGSALLTIEMKINYLEPITTGTVTAEAFVLRHSRRSAYAEVDVWAGGKLAARASTTYMIIPSSAAAPLAPR